VGREARRDVIPELERAEAEAFASVMSAAGLAVARVGGAVCFAAPGIPDIQLNRVSGLGLERDPSDDELDEIEAFFRGHGNRFAISLTPGPLHDRLVERGYTEGYAWMKFRRDAFPASPVTTELSIAETTDGDAFGSVVAEAFELPAGGGFFGGVVGRPGWTLFLCRAGGQPAGAAALFIYEGVGWFGIAGTVPEHRGKGAQSALLAARIARGLELGAHAFTTETGERVPDRPSGSYRNILRAGFEETYLRPNLLAPE
jgi:GNAT superfamily N-acetyltransferase